MFSLRFSSTNQSGCAFLWRNRRHALITSLHISFHESSRCLVRNVSRLEWACHLFRPLGTKGTPWSVRSAASRIVATSSSVASQVLWRDASEIWLMIFFATALSVELL